MIYTTEIFRQAKQTVFRRATSRIEAQDEYYEYVFFNLQESTTHKTFFRKPIFIIFIFFS
jgi:hypothetical protein